MDSPRIRLATLVDLPDIRRLWKALGQEMEPLASYPEHALAYIDTFTRSVALALTMQPPTCFIFLGTSPGSPEPDALILYEIQERQLGEPTRMAFFHFIYVSPDARNCGMANALCTMACEHMATQGLTHVEMTTYPGRDTWDDLGFVPFEVRHHATVARMMVGLEERTKRAMAAHGNGLDHDATPAPPVDEQQEDDDAPA